MAKGKGEEKKEAGPIRVKAMALGFYDNLRRRPGAVFTIKNEQEFSKRWMVKLVKQSAPAVEVEETKPDEDADAEPVI